MWRPGTRGGAGLRLLPARPPAATSSTGRATSSPAIQLFSRAVELDPTYPQAYAGLADCWSYLYLYRDRSETNRASADRASLQAVTLDPDSAQAQASRGLALSISGRERAGGACLRERRPARSRPVRGPLLLRAARVRLGPGAEGPRASTRRRCGCGRRTTRRRCSSLRSTTTAGGPREAAAVRRLGCRAGRAPSGARPRRRAGPLHGRERPGGPRRAPSAPASGPSAPARCVPTTAWCSTTSPASSRCSGLAEPALDCLETAVAQRAATEGLVRARQQPRLVALAPALPGAAAGALSARYPDPGDDYRGRGVRGESKLKPVVGSRATVLPTSVP